jgi:2-polyprenyl-6-methoxyphenol hydroxylase-like FAD-dependent oxidoreductase
MEKNVMPHLPKSIQPSFQAALKEQTIRVMPNSFLSASKNDHHGLILLGDALNMRHPLTGGGMTVALNDALLLSRLLTGVNLEDTYAVSSVMSSQFHWQRKHLDSIVNILSMALYSLFAADSDYLRILQLGCFNYFKLGWSSPPTHVPVYAFLRSGHLRRNLQHAGQRHCQAARVATAICRLSGHRLHRHLPLHLERADLDVRWTWASDMKRY